MFFCCRIKTQCYTPAVNTDIIMFFFILYKRRVSVYKHPIKLVIIIIIIIREWLTLPNRHGGMGLINPIHYSGSQYKASLAITQPLVDCLLNGEKDVSYKAMMKQLELINECLSNDEFWGILRYSRS